MSKRQEVFLLDEKNVFIANKGNSRDFVMIRQICNNDILIRSSDNLIVVDKKELLGVLLRKDFQ